VLKGGERHMKLTLHNNLQICDDPPVMPTAYWVKRQMRQAEPARLRNSLTFPKNPADSG
jgi:hypothetical protein